LYYTYGLGCNRRTRNCRWWWWWWCTLGLTFVIRKKSSLSAVDNGITVRKLWSSISQVIYVVETRSQQQIGTRLPGKAFGNISFKVRRENNFVKSEKSSFSSPECLDSFTLDISLVGRDSHRLVMDFAISFVKSTSRCGKFSTPNAFGLRSSCYRRLLKSSVQESWRICFASFLLPPPFTGW